MPEAPADPEPADDEALLARLRENPARGLPAVLTRYQAPLLRQAATVLATPPPPKTSSRRASSVCCQTAVLLQKLADEGDGQYAYIDDFREAERFFLRDLTRVLEVVARDAKAQVEFEPAMVERYRLIGYEKRDVADEKFRDDTVDGGEVNAGHTVTVIYELKLMEGVAGNLGAVHLRYADPDSRQVTETREIISDRRFREPFAAASPRFRLSVLVARFAEHLRKSYWVKGERLERVAEAAESLPPGLAREPETREFRDLLQRAAVLLARQA